MNAQKGMHCARSTRSVSRPQNQLKNSPLRRFIRNICTYTHTHCRTHKRQQNLWCISCCLPWFGKYSRKIECKVAGKRDEFRFEVRRRSNEIKKGDPRSCSFDFAWTDIGWGILFSIHLFTNWRKILLMSLVVGWQYQSSRRMQPKKII